MTHRILSQLEAQAAEFGVPSVQDYIQQIKLSDEVVTEIIEEERDGE